MPSIKLRGKKVTITLLLDLDDTLLNSNMDEFIPEYFKLLSNNLKDLVDPELLIKSLMLGTKQMFKKTSPEGSLSDVFAGEFYKLIEVPEEKLRSRLDLFYEEIFPTLEYLTSKKDDAIEFVKRSFNDNHRIVIATNPMFPLKAVEHRLRWAGLAPEDYDYSLITAYEDFHFTKENVAYFPEILGRLGWPDDPVLMIGNDLDMDIKPALQAGLPVFWVPEQTVIDSSNGEIPVGKLDDIYPWLIDQPMERLMFSMNKISSLKYALRATPAVFHGWINPNAKYKSHRINSIDKKALDVTILKLAAQEIENLHKANEYLNLNTNVRANISEKHDLKGIAKLTAQNSPIAEFTIRRQKLLWTIIEIEESDNSLNTNKIEEFTYLVREIVQNDIDTIRIASNSFV